MKKNPYLPNYPDFSNNGHYCCCDPEKPWYENPVAIAGGVAGAAAGAISTSMLRKRKD